MTDKPSMPVVTLATKITILRILGVPVFILLVVYYLHDLAAGTDNVHLRIGALVVFVLVALTDALDGYLARSRNEVTELGRVLDPLADKALLLSGTILLTRPLMQGLEPHLPLWYSATVISRDVVLVGGYLVVHHVVGKVVVWPSIFGKIATFLQMLAITWILGAWPDRYFDYLVIAAAFFTIVSAGQYLFSGVRQLEAGSKT
ncbi:MAG TPA: CDP-alcohol phosphatidyltransferase family protein [Kiritimatiellia bacterium]